MIKFLVMDVDGTLTDGKIYIGATGEMFKSFDVKDGCGIKDILPNYDIIPIIITARESEMLKIRCQELGITNYYQGVRDKLIKLYEITKAYSTNEILYTLKNCAYIGDDILDLQCMIPIKKAGGIVGCPLDAVDEVKAVSDFISSHNAGDGAVREFIRFLTKKDRNFDIKDRIYNAIDFVSQIDISNVSMGKHIIDDKSFFIVQEYTTKNIENCRLESHKKYVDVQWIVKGKEKIAISALNDLIIEEQYDAETDVAFWKAPNHMQECVLCDGSYVILYPHDGHMPCIEVGGPQRVKKIVIKIKI